MRPRVIYVKMNMEVGCDILAVKIWAPTKRMERLKKQELKPAVFCTGILGFSLCFLAK